MKRFFIIMGAMLCVALSASAQQQMPPIPVDPAVRIGKLDNGLTYYIRHNAEPAGQANFYIAQKVGSILENESQRGLAHFLEHMCFNGTKNFPGNGVIKYCESIGVKFGADLNAYTSIDETVYNIDNVPVATVPSAVDSCLWILHDWADGLLLTDEDIDRERGVIHEEWRTRMNAQMRMYEKILPALYPDGNRYGHRLPIGTMDVVDNFPYKVLRDYYEEWYRPDQQGVVVVGDINVDEVEAKIREIFGTIATPVNPSVREYVQIPDNAEPIVCLASDKEQPYAMAYIFCKHDAIPAEAKGTLDYLIYDYAKDMISQMMAQRILELSELPEPPFAQAQVADDDYFLAKTKKAFTGVVVFEPENLLMSTTTVYREMLRAMRNGFTASEYERAKAEYLNNLESAYNMREKTKSATYCSQYVRHFIDNEPIPGIENIFALAQQLAPNIPVDVVNQIAASFASEGNLAVAYLLPEKDGVSYPSEAEVAEAFKAVAAENIAPYEDKVSDEPLISSLPKPGKVKNVEVAKFGYKELTLSNGVKVYLKKTPFNADQIIMRATSFGGFSLYPESDALSIRAFSEFFTAGGVGNFSVTDLSKALAGKKVSVSPYVSYTSEGVRASSTPKDIETMMQLNYLYFTALRSDKDAFVSSRNKLAAVLRNAEVEPTTALQDSLYVTLYGKNPYIGQLKVAELEKVDYDRIMEIARERFSNAADFSFVFTGNFDEAVLIPLIEQYIATLPAKGKREKAKDITPYAVGETKCVFDKPMELPSTTVVYLESGKAKYNLKSTIAMNMANQALSVSLLEEIREKEGGTYGIQSVGQLNNIPSPTAVIQIVYQTNPERYEYLNSKIEAIVKDFVENGPAEENLAKARDYLLKNYDENIRENSYWTSAMIEYLNDGVDVISEYKNVVNSITVEDCRKAIADVYNQGNHALVVMNGVAK